MSKVCDELSKQYQLEVAASNFYTLLSNRFAVDGLCGFAKWASGESKEELAHAQLIADYMGRLGELITDTKPVEANVEGSDTLQVIKEALQLEQEYLQIYNEMWFVAQEEKDVPAMEFIAWFAKSQRESVDSLRVLAAKIDSANGGAGAILQLDSEIA